MLFKGFRDNLFACLSLFSFLWCFSVLAQNHRIFVTSTLYTGNLGGIEGADAKCQAQADSAGLGEVYKAILSDGSKNAKDRIIISSSVENMRRQVAAKDGADLWDGTILNILNYDERGIAISTTPKAWTGTDRFGNKTTTHCGNWGGISNLRATVGLTNRVNYRWIASKLAQCSARLRLYCISQFRSSPNHPPEASNASFNTNEDTELLGTVQAIDPDGDSISYRLSIGPTKGTVQVDPSGSFVYHPNPDVNGADQFQFIANDGVSDSNTATISIAINAVNDAPEAIGQSISLQKNSSYTGTLTASDKDGDPLTLKIVSGPAHGAIDLSSTGAITYKPNPNFYGSDSFQFSANDGQLDSNVAQVSIAVIHTNHPPVALSDSISIDEDVSFFGTMRASDPDGDSVSFRLVASPSKGEVTLLNALTGAYSYVPNPNADGLDSFSFQASDGLSLSNVATSTVTIRPVNDAPVASDQKVTLDEDTSTQISLSATDVDGDSLTYIIVTQPAHGSLSGTAPNLTYAPFKDYNGNDSFTFRANDGQVDSNLATVSITINPVNDPPIAMNGSLKTKQGVAVSGTLQASDVDGDPLNYSIVQNGSLGNVVITGGNSCTYTPNPGASGSDSFTFTVSDGKSYSNIARVDVTIDFIPTLTWKLKQKLTEFGDSIGSSGNKIIVGVVGGVYIYSLDSQKGWLLESKLDPPSSSDTIGRSVAIDGDVAIVGGGFTWDAAPGMMPGGAYIYRYDGRAWNFEAKLVAPARNDLPTGGLEGPLGNAVSISGNDVIVGAAAGDANVAPYLGSACIYHFDGSQWRFVKKLLPTYPNEPNTFGGSVSIAGGHAVVGGYRNWGEAFTERGVAYIFRENGNDWQFETKFVNGIWFGFSVFISGNRVFVGDPDIEKIYYDDNGQLHYDFSGSVSIYEYSEGESSWKLATTIVSPESSSHPFTIQFGKSISVSGDRVLIGDITKAYVYSLDILRGWNLEQKLSRPEGAGYFGETVSLSADKAFVRARYSYGYTAGVYYYHLE